MADDDTLEQVATAVEESDLTDEDVEEMRVLLEKLEGELDVYIDLGDLFSLGGRGYKRVIRAPAGVGSIRQYLDWREEHREKLTEGEDSSTPDPETVEPLRTMTLDDGYVYVPREIIETFDLEDDGLVRWYLSDDGEVSIRFDHQREGAFDDFEGAPMGGDGQVIHDLAGAERSDDVEDSDLLAGFGRLSDNDEAFLDCPLCGDEVFNTRGGKHLFSAHWEEIVELAEQRDED